VKVWLMTNLYVLYNSYSDYSGLGDSAVEVRPEWLKPFAVGKLSY